MARKTIPPPTLDQAIAWLRDHQFDVTPEAAGAFRVQKHGCVAILASGMSDQKEKSAVFNLRPHILLAGQPARILDRGYQKFLQVAGLPDRAATAGHLKALHLFQEELAQAIGHDQIYNEALGTVSDTYVYDRVKGRADVRP